MMTLSEPETPLDLGLDVSAAGTSAFAALGDWFPLPDLQLGLLGELLEKGGPVVAILLVMSVVALSVAMVKAAQFLWWGVGTGRRIAAMLEENRSGGLTAARRAMPRPATPAATVVLHALEGQAAGHAEGRVREDAERLALTTLGTLRAKLRVLEATSQLAPLLGLFGTVIGMIGAFQTLQAAGADADPTALAGGIWVALLTTAVGLAVAMPAALALYWFEGRLDREQQAMEDGLTQVFTGGLKDRPVKPIAASGATPPVPVPPPPGPVTRGIRDAAE